MSELDEILASASTPPAQPQPMKSAKEMLGDRLRTQMGSAGEKRKLEDPTNGSELMSKTQKMDSDLDAVANSLDLNKAEGNEAVVAQQLQNGGGQQKLLAKALMEKRPPPAGAGPPGVGPGPPGPGGLMGQPPMMGGMKPGQPPDRVLLQKLGDLHKENRREEIQALLSEHPQLMQKMKEHQIRAQAQAQAAGMNRMNNNMMVNDNMPMP